MNTVGRASISFMAIRQEPSKRFPAEPQSSQGNHGKWSPLRQEPEAPHKQRDLPELLTRDRPSYWSRGSAFHPRREPGDAKARD
jgi:hypothetical protein